MVKLKTKLIIIFSGMIADVPYQGGATWAVLQYLLGLRRLGHDVYFVEPVSEAVLSPSKSSGELTQSASITYFQQVMAEFGLEEKSALLLTGTKQTVGLDYERLRQISARTDLLI